jgi:hypothetical protein
MKSTVKNTGIIGGAKPRRPQALFLVLVVVGLLSLAGVVSADNYYNGTVPTTKLDGTVTGGVDVQFADTWTPTAQVTDWSKQDVDSSFTLQVNPQSYPVKFARLYVVPYAGSMSADYFGNLTVTVDGTKVVDSQPLDLSYNRITGTSCNATVSVPPFTSTTNGLCRVTSDYVAVINVTDLIAGKTNTNLAVNVKTFNLTGRFDGRIKTVQLAYGWDESGGSDTYYWINEGQDPVTKYLVNPYTTNSTTFNIGTAPSSYDANLWVDFVAGNSTSGPGYGKYWWNNVNLTPEGTYPPTNLATGTYAGLSHWAWNEASGVTTNTGNNILAYSRTNDYYKIVFGVFSIKPYV